LPAGRPLLPCPQWLPASTVWTLNSCRNLSGNMDSIASSYLRLPVACFCIFCSNGRAGY